MIRTLLTFTFLAAVFSHTANAWAANLAFGQTQTGAISSPAQSNSYTFSANANDVVDFTLVATSGNLAPKIQLYTSGGTLISSTYSGSPFGCSGSTLEMNTVKLSASGTYTVLVSDCSNTNTGNYTIYAQLTDNSSGAANLQFGQTDTGSVASAAQSNTYTFSANASDVVDFTLVATSGSLVPKIRLYNPAGTLNSSNYSGSPFGCSGSTLEMNTVTLPTSGTYTALVGDCGDTNTGNYTIYSQRTDGPAAPVVLLFGQVQTGSIISAAGSNSYTFSANANDVVDFTLVATGGSLVPKIRLYNPAGTLNSSNYSGSPFGCSGSTLEMNTVTLPTSGTYTVLVGDCSDTNTGNYAIYSQRTNTPTGAVTLPFAQAQTGLLGSVSGSNSYTFSANANDVVDFTLVATSGSLVPKIRLYNPAGTLNSSNYSGSPFGCSGSTLEMNTVTLSTSGTYTVLVGDCGDTNTGNYTIYSQRTNNPTNPIGLLWGQVQPGMIGSAAQSASYTFPGTANDVVDFTVVTTSGSLVPKIRLYNPAGTLLSSNYSGSPFGCSGSTVQMNSVKLPASGSYTVLAGDCSDTNTGNYNLSSQCFGTCLLSLVPSQIISPTPGTVLTGNTVTFTWSTSSGASAYWLDVGTIFGQGNIFGQNVGLNTSQTVSGIPANGSTIYVRLWTLLAGTWQYNAYTYTALTAATLLTPPPGSTLSGSTATFTWSAGSGASAYWLDVGTVFGQGNIFGQNVGLITSQTVSGIPTNGSTIYVRLWTLLAGTWQYNAYTYTAASPSGSGILTPVPGSVLPSPSATFTWTAVAGADQYWLDLGSAVGIGDYFGAATTGTSFGVNSLPCDARAVHVQLWTHISGNWQTPVRYTYTAASGCAALTSPANDAVFTGTSVTFAWNAISGADQYWLDVGNAIAQGDIFGGSTTATSITVNNIPCDSRTLYGQLWTHSGGAWHNPGRYNFVAWGACGRLTTPTPGSTLLGSAVTFNWNAGTGVTAYWLDVGTVLGQGNIYGANVGTAISQTVLGIPVNGSPIYVQLWSQIGGVWHLNRYSYTAF